VCSPATGECEGETNKPDGSMCEPFPLAGLTGHFCIMGGCTGQPTPRGALHKFSYIKHSPTMHISNRHWESQQLQDATTAVSIDVTGGHGCSSGRKVCFAESISPVGSS
jgi:hypothetical protein